MSIDWTKPVYVNQEQCSRELEDLFVKEATYKAGMPLHRFGSTIMLHGPTQARVGDNWIMWAEESNCSNTPWPIPAAASPPTPKPVEDRLTDLAIELRAHPNYASDALIQHAADHMRQAIAILDRAAADKRRKEQGL